MNINAWYKKRGIDFILERVQKLNKRYGISPQKAIDRIDHFMEVLLEHNCPPTFAVPGIVVERNSNYIRHLQDEGAEIAVHGYNHVDLKSYPPDQASRQLKRAADVFVVHGLEVSGFRCPYLSVTDELIEALPPGVFEYSSNKAVQWPIARPLGMPTGLLFDTIIKFYAPVKYESTLCLPWFQKGLVEIPVFVPDDLQLHDGLGLGLEQITRVWFDILYQSHQRGEICNLMFHPEIATFCEIPFLNVIRESMTLHPGVWLAQLKDVSAWWNEKSNFRVDIEAIDDHFILKFHCTPRATLLCRGFDLNVPTSHWDEVYRVFDSRFLHIDGSDLPLVGLSPNIPEWITTTLQRMGYIVVTGEWATRCSLYLDETCQGMFENPVDLIASIEITSVPLVRFWPWPDGNRSVLCISGDLDSLSLIDYAARLFKT